MMFGITPDHLADIDSAEDPLPGSHRTPGGQRRYYYSRSLCERAKAHRERRKASRFNTAWKYNLEADWPEPSPETSARADGFIAALFEDLPGVRVGPTGLDTSGVPESAKAAVFRQIGARLSNMDEAWPWWIGDLLHKMQVTGKHIPIPRLKEWGLNLNVAAFFPPDARETALTFNHHAEAYRAAVKSGEGLVRAKAWLALAKEKGWRPSQLREFLRCLIETKT